MILILFIFFLSQKVYQHAWKASIVKALQFIHNYVHDIIQVNIPFIHYVYSDQHIKS